MIFRRVAILVVSADDKATVYLSTNQVVERVAELQWRALSSALGNFLRRERFCF